MSVVSQPSITCQGGVEVQFAPVTDQGKYHVFRMLLDIQNRGQLAAGMTTGLIGALLANRKMWYCRVFRLNHRAKAESLMRSRQV